MIMSSKSTKARRVVTGVDENGKSYVWLDGDVPKNAFFNSTERRTSRTIWATDTIPATLQKKHDPMVDWFPEHGFFPKTGVHFILLTLEPGEINPMHASETIDCLIIVSGQIELILEKGSTILGPGDCLVQRGTQHGWRVIGDEPCTFAGILIAKKSEDG
jgi:quercetin dioxygenase-like cupin family protein